MNGRARIMRIFQGKMPDRPAIKLWGLSIGQQLADPLYRQVYNLAVEKTDIFETSSSPINLYAGIHTKAITQTFKQVDNTGVWTDRTTLIHAPDGILTEIYRESNERYHGHHLQYLIKEPEDIKKLLSLQYEPYPVSLSSYEKADQRAGERGIAMFHLPHTGYGMQDLMGSETLAHFLVECPELLDELAETFANRIKGHVKKVLEKGIKLVFAWVGPELFIPPLTSVAHFERYVTRFDKPLIDMIHNSGGYVWVHCHGGMKPVIMKFEEMGVDLLNPIEPPPMGDLTLKEAYSKITGKMALEGNIETHDLMASTPDHIRCLVHETLDTAKEYAGGRFILCPSAGYMENLKPHIQYIDNLVTYIKEGYAYAECMGKRANA